MTSGGLAAVSSLFFAALYSAFGKYDVVHAISIKVPAIQVEFRRMLPFEDDNGGKLSYTLNGTLYPNEQVVIYDIGDVKPETEKKRRGRRKKSEIEAEQKEN